MDQKIVIYEQFNNSLAALSVSTKEIIENNIKKVINIDASYQINYQKDSKMYFYDIDRKYTVSYFCLDGIYVYIYVDLKEKTLSWASNKICDINKNTGSVQIYQVGEPISIIATNDLFHKYTDNQLITLGLPKIQLELLRSFSTIDDLNDNKEYFDKNTFQILKQLIITNEYEELAEFVNETYSNNENFNQAFQSYLSKSSFAIVGNDDELHKIINEPLEKWRVYLHPRQRMYSETKYNGPVKIMGEAGTGKTVVAMHRTKYLLNKNKKVLFTTFTTNLARDIEHNLSSIVPSEQLSNLKVTNVDSYVYEYMKENHISGNLIYDEDILDEYWQKAIDKAGVPLDFDLEFYKREWREIYTFLDEMNIVSYISAKRPGTAKAINRGQRKEIIKVFDEFVKLLNLNNVKDINFALHECCRYQKENKKYNFDSIIIDELQDMGRNQLKFLRLLVEEKEDDMFLVGDSRQRIYNAKIAVKEANIDTKNRSFVLDINYRTTEEISKMAKKVLGCVDIDDMDGNEYEKLENAESLTHGEFPIRKIFNNFTEQMDYVYAELLKLTNYKAKLQDICIVARNKLELEKISEYFSKLKVPTHMVNTEQYDNPNISKLKLATMHRIKGLEFKYIFVVSLNEKIINVKTSTDERLEEYNFHNEYALLYVAMTRAQKKVYLLSYDKLSCMLENIFSIDENRPIIVEEDLQKFMSESIKLENLIKQDKTIDEFVDQQEETWQDILKKHMNKNHFSLMQLSMTSLSSYSSLKKMMRFTMEPNKETLINVSITLRLSYHELVELLGRAGISLSMTYPEDKIVAYYFIKRNWDRNAINNMCFKYNVKKLFGANE